MLKHILNLLVYLWVKVLKFLGFRNTHVTNGSPGWWLIINKYLSIIYRKKTKHALKNFSDNLLQVTIIM